MFCGVQHAECYEVSLKVIGETYPRQFLNDKYGITSGADFVHAWRAVARAMEGIRGRRQVRSRKEPPGLYRLQALHLHIVHFMSNMVSDPRLFQMERQIPHSRWSSVWR